MKRPSGSHFSAAGALELESTIDINDVVWEDQNTNISMSPNGTEDGNVDETSFDASDDSVSLYPDDVGDPHPGYLQPQQDVKLINAHGYLSSHDRQIERLQRDHENRIHGYNLMKLQLDRRSHDLQHQITEMRNELSMTRDSTSAQIERINFRLSQFEQQQLTCQQSADLEFTALRDVINQVCTSFVSLEERIELEKLFRPRPRPLQQPQPQPQPQPQFQEVTFSNPVGIPGPSSDTLTASRRNPLRVSCSLCGTYLSKYYIKAHVRKHCKNRVSSSTTVLARARPPVPVLVSGEVNSNSWIQLDD